MRPFSQVLILLFELSFFYVDCDLFSCLIEKLEKGKVNAICEALRKELLPKLQTDSSSSIINPILCTFAKQRPPLLVEALRCIKEYATTTEQQSNVKTINDNNIDNNNKNICDGDNSSNANSAENFNFPEPNLKVAKVSVPKMQAAIKYLAFLADGSQLFEAALSVCDFHMCRIIARQCQMDPKAYMPLLERCPLLMVLTMNIW